MSSLSTKLSVQQIQYALYRHLFDARNDIVVPNVSWGLLPYEADLLGVNKSGQVTEVEIKRSLSDLRADFKKHHHHDDDSITYFYYCVPESIVDKAKAAILVNEQSMRPFPVEGKDCPALLCFTEDGAIKETGFGSPKRFGYHGSSVDERATLGRLGTIRYWNILPDVMHPEDAGEKKKIRDLQNELRLTKGVLKTCEDDYNMLKRLLRYKYPGIWQEYLNIDVEADRYEPTKPTVTQASEIDAVNSGVNRFIESMVTKYGLKVKGGAEIKRRPVGANVSSDSVMVTHATDNYVTELLYNGKLVAMVYERRDDMNYTEVNCIDMHPTL